MIPFDETRNYVQRVLENLQVYRQRLGVAQAAATASPDLRRRW
jgi:soluble lytic murein transglycosylase